MVSQIDYTVTLTVLSDVQAVSCKVQDLVLLEIKEMGQTMLPAALFPIVNLLSMPIFSAKLI